MNKGRTLKTSSTAFERISLYHVCWMKAKAVQRRLEKCQLQLCNQGNSIWLFIASYLELVKRITSRISADLWGSRTGSCVVLKIRLWNV